jgi:hypothetical protein
LSRYRPEQAFGGSGRLRLRIFHDFRHYEGGKVVTLTYRPSVPPGVVVVVVVVVVKISEGFLEGP